MKELAKAMKDELGWISLFLFIITLTICSFSDDIDEISEVKHELRQTRQELREIKAILEAKK